MVESSEVGLVLIQRLFSEGRITDDQRDSLKGMNNNSYNLDMIFDEDALLLSLFERFQEDEEELAEEIVKYCTKGSTGMEFNRPPGIETVRNDPNELDMVRKLSMMPQ